MRENYVAAFDAYCKKCLKFAVIDYKNRQKKLQSAEIPTEMADEGIPFDEELLVASRLKVLNFEIQIKNELLYDALRSMHQKNIDILYLSACENMSDYQIARYLNIPRATVQYIRTSSKEKIRKMMGGSIL